MQAINGTGGLCMTCNNAPTCFHHARRGPALFCELFDNYAPPVVQARVAMAPPSTAPSIRDRTAEEEAAEYTGLCMNCENRRICGHSKPEGGIWHCEDYR